MRLDVFDVLTCHTFPCLNDSKHPSIVLADRQSPPKNVSAEKLPQKVASVRKAAQFITQPLFFVFHESFFPSNSSGEVRRNKERKKER